MNIETLHQELEALEDSIRSLVRGFTERTRCTVKVTADAYLQSQGEVCLSTMLHAGISTSSRRGAAETS